MYCGHRKSSTAQVTNLRLKAPDFVRPIPPGSVAHRSTVIAAPHNLLPAKASLSSSSLRKRRGLKRVTTVTRWFPAEGSEVRLKASNIPSEETTIANWEPLLLRHHDFVNCPDLFRHGADGTGRRVHDPTRKWIRTPSQPTSIQRLAIVADSQCTKRATVLTTSWLSAGLLKTGASGHFCLASVGS